MTLIFEADLVRVQMNQHANHLHQQSFTSKFLVHAYAHTPGPIALPEGQFWGRKGVRQGCIWTCPAADMFKTTQQGAEPIRCGCQLDGVY